MEDALCINLRDEHVRCFQDQGFLRLSRITTDQELAWLKEVYDEVVKRKIGYTPHELGRRNVRLEHESLVTILSPESVIPELKDTIFYRNARKTLAYLLNVQETNLLTGWRIFFKRAHASETPWHQDAAYRPPPYHSASIWMPLDPATLESSCMHYVKGSHHGDVRPHHLHGDHLMVNGVDSSQAVACPLSPGEALAHHCCTLHYAGPNRTDQPRRALVVVCQVEENNK